MEGLPVARRAPARGVHCDVDDWDFDPRYTEGACPICGWRPNSTVSAKPSWQIRVEALPWDYIGLTILAVVLVVIGVFVALAAHIDILPKG